MFSAKSSPRELRPSQYREKLENAKLTFTSKGKPHGCFHIPASKKLKCTNILHLRLA